MLPVFTLRSVRCVSPSSLCRWWKQGWPSRTGAWGSSFESSLGEISLSLYSCAEKAQSIDNCRWKPLWMPFWDQKCQCNQCYHMRKVFLMYLLENGNLIMPYVQAEGGLSQPHSWKRCRQSLTLLPSSTLEVWPGCSWCLSCCSSLCTAAGSVSPKLTPSVSIWNLFSTVTNCFPVRFHSSQVVPLGCSWCSAELHLCRSSLVFTRIWPFISPSFLLLCSVFIRVSLIQLLNQDEQLQNYFHFMPASNFQSPFM